MMTYLKDEKQWVRACLEDDLLAQKALYQHFASKMMGVCLRFAKTRTEAEDMLQDGFYRVFCDIGQYKGDGSLEGWVRKVIVNVALQHVRRRKMLFDSNTTPEELPEPENGYEDTFPVFLMDDLLNALQQLPEGCQVVFNLYVLEGFSHQEIASQLNITTGTSKSQLSKARSLLKEQFAKMDILT
ncbi:MAG: sigma-70 family RNA polymerase sigma factor [Saprospiraceae bacterium]|nr:sigma-70 family RNA polymerase sigma factor [Saprospiraceae bacterium]